MARYGQWYIGGETGSGSRGVEINSVEMCVEDIANANWFEWENSQWIESKNLTLQCVDSVMCSCQKLDISGFRHQTRRNGLYIFNNSSLNGRNRFRHKVDAFTIKDKIFLP